MEVNEMKEDEDRPSVIMPGDYGIPIPRELRFREMGLPPNTWASRHFTGKRVVSETLATNADSTLTHKELDKMRFKLPQGARTTFHMAFSNDGKLVASCHGDHNVYVCEVKTGRVLQTLTGHPRTPWCVVFHPTQNDILASGCLAGHVRVWDLKSGSELLVTDSGTVIASIAFHPTVRLLAIGTFNEVIFWDWSRSVPLARCSTENTKEKVRLVRFDRLGRSLITGITNFPNAPATTATREASRLNSRSTDDNPAPAATRGGGFIFRPNILRNHRSSAVPSASARDIDADREDVLVNDEGMDLVEDPLVAAAAAAVDEDEQQVAVADVLNDRQDRFQESYRQLVSHYEDLVEHYHTFLRTRIPPMLEISSQAEANASLDALIQEPQSSQPSTVPIEELQPEVMILEERVLPVVVADNPFSQDEDARPGPSRLMRVIGGAEDLGSIASSGAAAETIQEPDDAINASVATATVTERTPAAGLGSIEALAQNILEMQNLCSRARRNAPSLSIETQHIVELQHIRQHLEVLQDQTRRLQSSIRATLTSLASGSLAATLRSANFGPPSSARNTDASASESSPESPPVSPAANQSEQSEESRSSSDSTQPVIRRSISPSNSSNPNTFFRISIGQSDSGSNLSRMRVPPMVTMRYDSSETPNSPTPGPSTRGVIQGQGPPRRIIREFHVIPRQFGEEHSRNCPFSSNSSIRPPPRMRCLAETETPRLTMWPGYGDTGISVRDFGVNGEAAVPQRRDITGANNQTASTAGSGGGFAYQPLNISDAPLVGPSVPQPQSFNQILSSSGPVTNDVGVRVFLTVRQNRDGQNGQTEENWQRVFPSGLGLVPPAVREGRRNSLQYQRRRRAQWVCQLGTTSSANRLCHNNATPQPHCSRTSETIQPSSSPNNQPPLRLGSLTRSFYIRTQEELIPVYSVTSNEPPQSEVIRDGLQSNVFQYPIGLFLEGPFDAQTIGIYWPPSTAREEDDNISNRHSESPIPVFTSAGTNRIRITYDSSTMEIHLPQGTLNFIQPGLPILDTITEYGSLPRPRPTEGTVWIDNVCSFFEALERLFFGTRNGRRPFGSSRLPVGVARVSQQILNLSSRGNGSGSRGSSGGYAHGTVGERRPAQRIDNPRRIITFAQDANANEPGLSIWSDNGLSSSAFRSSRLSRDYFHGPPASQEEASSRTVLSLAVDTAASELLRNQSGYLQQTSAESSRLLPVESRIERVLNERGNRGAQSASTSGEETNRSRLEDIQRRISMLSHWSRGNGNRLSSSSSAGTQTSQSFLEPNSHRRRVYPAPNANSNNANDESGPPHRMARFSEVERTANNQGNQEFGYTGPFGDHWVIRRQRRLSSPRPRLLTAASGGLPVPADGTSARTRASAQLLQLQSQQNQQNNESPETGSNRPRSSVTLHFPPPPIAHQFQGSNEDPPDPAGARFYPGYIPEILITPRARPPTYYTMDAATTAFLSSRIQKWDFSEFFIPDITKRDDCIVVRECSLHSDACLDISSDSEFLAVLQPSDSGAYSALGVYSLRDECLGDMMYIFHFDQNTVSVSISPSCDFIVVGYAGRGPLYRFVQPSKNIGQILSLTRDDGDSSKMRLVPVRELYTDSQSPLMAINCISYLPVPGMGIVYGTNTGDLVLLS